jgi:osmotically-inducible protein OsmY
MKWIPQTKSARYGILVLAALFVSLPGLVAGTASRDITDGTIRSAVEDEFLYDRAVPLNDIDVSVDAGIVTLTGKVDNLLAQERAAKVARTVKGVRSVVDRIEVQPRTKRADKDVERDVRMALLSDPATDSYEVGVRVEGGVVTLTGTIQSWQEKHLVETVAKSVEGVTGIQSELDVNYTMARSDYEVKQEIDDALDWDVLVDGGLIAVGVDNGKVTLSGTVGSAAEKTRAVSDAWIAGVTEVDAAKLDVARWARDDDLRKHKYVPRTDQEIQSAVEAALVRDPRVSSFDVQTAVDSGIVTLRGNVDYLKAKRAADADARNTVGALRIDNRIKVRPVDILADSDIRSRVIDALARDAVVDASQIDVRVARGTVSLDGDVDTYYEKYHADDIASRVAGVIRVRNHLDVDYGGRWSLYDPYVDPYAYPYADESLWNDVPPRATLQSDKEIQSDVESELFWSPFVDSDEVQVTVHDGVVTLTGTVDSWAEVAAAVENAYEGGAARVDNDLTVGGHTS